ncbi:flavin-containing superfamily Amine oxidase [Colletotrichum truncatum]|uniref:Flavin-containing superfamily Amine oxidase n=1 Tax=Colletotrichum truncatum TaxID=5467 RepID=A0ACC3YFN1_COLTU|nr:flavin-containing superfamily Amine oxidase [Colletotrichum truncatum]KAF6788400.1 flavin-containing superfamily Amine oxidase [Colletotrichum truncatum]
MLSSLAGAVVFNSLLGGVLAHPTVDHDSLLRRYTPDEVIRRDVAIIGGGSSGTYSAIRLKDSGKNVVVVEAKDVLGGHTETYFDEATGRYHDYGVVALANDSIVNPYLERLGIPMIPVPTGGPSLKTVYFDFEQQQLLSNYTPDIDAEALLRWSEAVAQYPFLEEGGLENVPVPVPEDLLLPLDEFLEKNGIGDPEFLHHDYNQGVGDPLRQTTLYAAKLMNARTFEWITNGWLTHANGNNHDIYDKALEVLGDDALLGTRVISMDRSGDLVRVLVQTPSGIKLIEAEKLLVTIPLFPYNLEGFDLSPDESQLFSQFNATGYYTAILRNTGLSNDIRVNNIGSKNPYQLRKFPGAYAYRPAGIDGLFDVTLGSQGFLPDAYVKSIVVDDLKSLQEAGVISKDVDVEKTEFVRYAAHNPFTPTVSAENIRNGFYKKLFSLQGQRHTYYTGGSWSIQDSSGLWRFTEEKVLPLVLE